MLPRDSRPHVGVRARAAAAADGPQEPPQVVRDLSRAEPPPRPRDQAPTTRAIELHRTE